MPDHQRQHGKSWLRQASCASLRTRESEVQKPTVRLRLAEPQPGRCSQKPSGFMTANPTAPQEHLHLCWCIHIEFVNLARTSLCYFCSFLQSFLMHVCSYLGDAATVYKRDHLRVGFCFNVEPAVASSTAPHTLITFKDDWAIKRCLTTDVIRSLPSTSSSLSHTTTASLVPKVMDVES